MSAAQRNEDRTDEAAWKDLVESPGWDRLVAYVKAEYEGPAFLNQIESLANNPDDPMALSKMRQLLAAKRAVMRVIEHPKARLRGHDPRVISAEELQAAIQGRRGPL